jgi:hypothetical protein
MGLGDIVKKDCEAFLKKNGIKQCENIKPICSLLESFTNKTIKNNSKCKEKKAVKQPSVKKEPTVKQPSVKQPSIKKEEIKQPSIKKEEIKQPSVKQPSVKQMSIKKQEIPPPPSYEEATKFDLELIRKYIEVTFKRVGVEFKNCDDIEKYKEELRKKCIKFLGYDSPAKTPECVKFRFRKFLKENSKMEDNLVKIGCKV